jgi:SAM-dependent methyltransferase
VHSKPAGTGQPYDAIARLYDPWSRSVTEDIAFYVEEALNVAPGPVVELGVGTGRIAIPIASEGIRLIGVDSSPGMIEVCREQADLAGVADLVDLRLGDYREPPVSERTRLVLCPFRAYLHMHTDVARREALAAAYELLVPGGRFVFDVFTPDPHEMEETQGRWLEREPGIFERADWDVEQQKLTLSLRGPSGETDMALGWIAAEEWGALLEASGFRVDACYGWFDRRAWDGHADSIWIASRPV